MVLEQRRPKDHNALRNHSPSSSRRSTPFDLVQIRTWRVRRNRSIRLCASYVLLVILGAVAGESIEASDSYFSDKRNPFNRFFVKYGWAWTTLAFSSCAYIGSQITTTTVGDQRLRRSSHGDKDDLNRFARYAIATGYWTAMTQWCWGPPLIDRLFSATGGTCSIPTLTYGVECKRAGGKWQGGHDASGHCMMLIHAALFLWEEVIAGGFLPFGSTTATDKDGKDLGGVGLGAKIRARGGIVGYLASTFAVLLVLLWTWMILTTALYFHPIEEKISGTIFGIIGWAATYLFTYPYLEFPGMPLRE